MGVEYASNNFTVYVVSKPTQTHEVDSEAISGTTGISGQRYLLFPHNNGGSDAGTGISLGSNGVSVYEHAGAYMPALVVHSAVFSTPKIITLVYSAKQPSIYINGALARTGLTSTKPASLAPRIIGGLQYGAFAGQIYEVFAYDRVLTSTERNNMVTYLQNKDSALN